MDGDLAIQQTTSLLSDSRIIFIGTVAPAGGKAACFWTLPLRAAGSRAKAQAIFGKDIGQVPFQPLPWYFVVLGESTASLGEAWEPITYSGKVQKPLGFAHNFLS